MLALLLSPFLAKVLKEFDGKIPEQTTKSFVVFTNAL